MLIAYIDEFGHDGPFIAPEHRKYHQHPAFGYAGFVIPAVHVRAFGAYFKRQRNVLFKDLIASSSAPDQFEKKGNEYFSTGSIQRYPQHIRVFRNILRELYRQGGQIFFYGREKLTGTVAQTGCSSRETVEHALRETINRLSRHADVNDDEILIIADSINDKTRREIAAQMYGHIYRRSGEHAEMRRAVEVPLHIESKLNTNIQFADWVCALVARASHYQLIRESEFEWASRLLGDDLRGHFTYESVLHTLRPSEKILNSALVAARRPRFPKLAAGAIGSSNPQLTAFYDTLRAQSATRKASKK